MHPLSEQAIACLSHCSVLPVLTLSNVDSALYIGESLVSAGVHVAEITLRSPAALSAIELLSSKLPELQVGAGTLLHTAQLKDVKNAGGKFALSPGIHESFLINALDVGLPYIPGVATPSDVMLAQAAGYGFCKLFPAKTLGGTEYIKALAGPFPQMQFCPTGGVRISEAAEFLALDSVVCVGSSKLVPTEWMNPAKDEQQENQKPLHVHIKKIMSTIMSTAVSAI